MSNDSTAVSNESSFDDATDDSLDVGEWQRGFAKSRYGIIRHAVSPETAAIGAQYMRILHEHYQPTMLFNERQQSFGRYGDPLGESVLAVILPKVCRLTGLELLPTYSYSRMYGFGGVLDKHIDRPSCEISGTLLLECDTAWPIFVEVDGEEREVNLQPGDLMIYRGCELPHWRERFSGEFSAHIFLHFVEASGRYANLIYDERPGLGGPQTKIRPLRVPPWALKAEGVKPPNPPREAKPMPHVRRNEPCPCGSGKKFKLCHGAKE